MNPNVSSETPQRLHPTVFDTGAAQIARAYAVALYDAAQAAGQVDAVVEEYESFIGDVLARNPDFERALTSGVIGRDDKAATLRRVFENRASSMFLNFLLVMNDHRRLDLLRAVLPQLHTIRDQRRGLVPVHVQSAAALDPAEVSAIESRLAAVVAGRPVVHHETDPALLGGMVIRVGDTVFDGSVRTRLRRMREQLIQRSTHEIQSRRDQFRSAT
jgi:F-type H+-transporting ATPase subunit delta